MQIDPAATLTTWAIDVDLAGRTYTIPPLPAAEWILAVLDGSWLAIVPGLIPELEDLDDEIIDGDVSFDDVVAAAKDALAAAAGTKWWTAVRLCRASVDTWAGQELLLRGIDPAKVPLAAFLAATYRAATRASDNAKRMQLDMELDKPPAGVPVEEWFDEAAAAESFLQMAKSDPH